MKQTAMLTTASLLTILLMTFHLTGDILFRMSPAGLVKSVCGVRLGSLAMWNAAARRKASGIHHHLLRVGPRAGHPCHPHERDAGCSRWRHRHLGPSFPFRVDTPRVGHHRDVLHHPIGARTVELALAPEPPRVNCRITPVADICRDRPCLTERLREGATGSKGNWLRTAKS